MKNKSIVSLLSIVALLLMLSVSANIYALNYSISFTATGASNSVESVIVQNLTKGTTVTVPAGNVLSLSDGLNAVNQLTANDESLKIYPNPTNENTTISFNSKLSGITQINVLAGDGRKLAGVIKNTDAGVNQFQLSLPKGVYAIQVNGNGFSNTAKLISHSKSQNKTEIIYIGSVKSNSNTPQKIKSSVSTMLYSLGDRLIYKGISGNFSTIVADVPTNSKVINFHFFECKDMDGNYYPIVKIGSQIWMAENLKTSQYRNNVAITNKTSDANWSSLSTAAFCEYNTTSKNTIYGKLYNWYAVKDSRLIAPLGWHIPTDAEWTTLTDFCGGDSIAGNKLKEDGPIHWGNLNTTATNESGFTALPGGVCTNGGSVYDIGQIGYWWSNSENNNSMGLYRNLYSKFGSASRGDYSKSGGMSVRCVKDIQTLTTSTISITSTTSAIGGGFISYDGGEPITERGVCWSTSPNPTILNSKTTDGPGTGAFTSTIFGLTKATRYYLKAYATNSLGTAYGNELSFTTVPINADGFYITGDASAFPGIEIAGQFKSTPLENENFIERNGLVDKYVALESGKTFTITEVSGTNINEYGAGNNFANVVQPGGNDEMAGSLQQGNYSLGSTFTVPVSGLYHVVVDKQTASVVIIPVTKWAIIGGATPLSWSDNDMLAKGVFSKDTMVFEINDITLKTGDYKFRHSGAWKQTVISNPLIKVCTNFGGTLSALVAGGSNIQLLPANNGIYTVNATWGKNTGMKFSMTKTGNVVYPNPNTFKYSLIGDAFNNASGSRAAWDYDLDLVYNASLSTIIDQTTNTGVFIYKADNIKLLAGGIFKVRKNHSWEITYGYVATNIKGDSGNFVDDSGNMKVITTTTYSSVEFILTYPEETWQIKFTK
jgi:uncharacterized protein (TIGR02145 family)